MTMFEEKQTFGLRKLSIGLASVLLAMSFAAAKPTGVQAAEPESNNVEKTEENAPEVEADGQGESSQSNLSKAEQITVGQAKRAVETKD